MYHKEVLEYFMKYRQFSEVCESPFGVQVIVLSVDRWSLYRGARADYPWAIWSTVASIDVQVAHMGALAGDSR